MKKIDRETRQRILDAADIVEVVSDFVSLKRKGANYMGLCPFHAERTPSFSVNKAKGICKCFSCGKGGSPVNFLMELEQMTFQEALRWLAKKYNIPIREREETEEERRQESEREALYAVNNFALNHFVHNLLETEDGREIGLAYFTERALSLETIKKFQLGYALEKSDSLYNDAIRHGYTEENLIKTGLCARSERGVYDRFRGRVIYPVHTISGKIVAFGGRTLKSDKTIAKYVNSPESAIYSKSRELYGLFQARRAINKEDKCFLVEGYMDVLSMSQSGVENVVASSGTSLTTQQVNLIHRFTGNVTVIYDADPAGIKASLRGVDMLLSEGMNVKVVLFPEGEDPDSYARSHTHEELKQYIAEHETDFIKFKTEVLLSDVAGDPIGRSRVIADILRSIAVIPDRITRQVYIEETARTFNMDARVLALEVAKGVAKIAEENFIRNRTASGATISMENSEPTEVTSGDHSTSGDKKVDTTSDLKIDSKTNPLLKFERELARYAVKYGMLVLVDAYDEEGNSTPITVLEYILSEMSKDDIEWSDSVFVRLFGHLDELWREWPGEEAALRDERIRMGAELKERGLEEIRRNATSLGEISKAEALLENDIETRLNEYEHSVRRKFFEKELLSSDDDELRHLATTLVSEKHNLSKIHSRHNPVQSEEERIIDLLPRAVFELKDAILRLQIENLNRELVNPENDTQTIASIMEQLMEKNRIRSEFAQYLGERIITPRIR